MNGCDEWSVEMVSMLFMILYCSMLMRVFHNGSCVFWGGGGIGCWFSIMDRVASGAYCMVAGRAGGQL
jgi:hypothetical protein